jgi:hypothetical protein
MTSRAKHLFYRPPNQSAVKRDTFLFEFDSCVSRALSSNADCVVIMGDFHDRCVKLNCSHLSSELKYKLRDSSQSLGLKQLVDVPTHVNAQGRPDHLLDYSCTSV